MAGLVMAVIIASWGRWRWWLVFGGGLLAGYGLTDGLFMVWRWQATGNPLFPFAQVWLGDKLRIGDRPARLSGVNWGLIWHSRLRGCTAAIRLKLGPCVIPAYSWHMRVSQ
ncbi:hypothetical protein IPG36_01595 [bacterium]|nr:MAG: hypothetical protein IPG36_01595 [bacterium]